MTWISIGRSSNGEAACEMGREYIVVDDLCPVDAGSNVFVMLGCESAAGCGKGRCVDDNERRKTALTRGRRSFQLGRDVVTAFSELLTLSQSHFSVSEGFINKVSRTGANLRQ